MTEDKRESLNFIEQIIEEDLKNGKHSGRVLTRFPPEPNGYLHIGHAKAICINFETAKKYGGSTNLRFDDTNPTTEDTEYVESIQNDIKWLGFEWNNEPLYASDYFSTLYDYAVKLIKKGLAYVDDSTPEQIAEMKGTPAERGKDSPFKSRSIDENLNLFERMKNGEFSDGAKYSEQMSIWLHLICSCATLLFTGLKKNIIIVQEKIGVSILCMILPMANLTL